MRNVVEINGLSKSYGKVKAIDNVSFTIEPDKIYGLLGRNGAGKTTIMHMITAQLFATRGELKVFGEAPYENTRVLNQICFIKESLKYPEYFHIDDVLRIASALFSNWDQDFALALIEDFQLPLKRKIKKLSRGMLSAVGIIVGLASRAPLTIFDEPYLGLDAVARSLFYNRLLEDYATHPRTIILSTHLIDEVSQILEHVIVIDKGKIIINEEADTLRGRASTVAGSTAKVGTFTEGKKVINREPLPFAISFSVRRKDYFLGTLATIAGISLVYAIMLWALDYFESETVGWGVKMHFFKLPYLSDSNAIGQIWVQASTMFHLYFLGFVISSVYRRFGKVGLYTFFLIVFVVSSVGPLLFTFYYSWSSIGDWFESVTAVEAASGLFPITLIYLLLSYLLLRRSTI